MRRIACVSTLLALALLGAAPAFAAGSDVWTRWAASPNEATVRSLDFIGPQLFGASEDDGVFISPSVTGPWTQQNSGLDAAGAKSVHQVVSSSGQLYAATSAGLFRSAGGDQPWQPVGQGSGPRLLNMGGVQSIVVNSPADLVVAVAGAGGAGVYFSSDSGEHWDRASGMPTPENVFYLTTGPAGAPIYAAADDGVFTSFDAGRSWTLTSDGIAPSETTLRVAVAPENPAHLYASTSSSVYKSYTGGATWTLAMGGFDFPLPAAGGKRAFLLAPSLNAQFGAKHALVGTEKGVWATVDDGDDWGQMSPDSFTTAGEMNNRIVWSLGLGFSPPSLMAGTQGFGVYALPLQPVSAPGSLTISPSSSLTEGKTLTVPISGFGGTLPIFFTYQWKKCSSSASCTATSNIAGATASSYTIPSADINANTRYRVVVCGINLVSPQPVCTTSGLTTAGVAGPSTSTPQPFFGSPSMSPNPSVSYAWGQVMTIDNGSWRTEGSSASITPDAFFYRWRRCDGNGANCADIQGATAKTYTLQPEDVGGEIEGQARAVDNGVSSAFYVAGHTFDVIEKTPVNTEKPEVVGDAYTGRVLSSSVGAWDAHNPSFARRWFRCESDGLGCNPISGQTGTTYTTTAADLGKRLQIEVTATVVDPNQNRVTKAYSDPGPVITDPPPPPPASGGDGTGGGGGTTGGGGGGGTTTPDVTAPVIGAVTLGSKTVKPGGTIKLGYQVSEPGTLRLLVQRLRPGHKKGKTCVAGRKRKAKKCTVVKTVIKRTATAAAGAGTLAIKAKVGKKKLKPGSYRLVLTITDAAGNAGVKKIVKFKIRR